MTVANDDDGLTVAILVATLAKAMNATEPGFLERFNAALDESYGEAKANPVIPVRTLELLRWTREMANR